MDCVKQCSKFTFFFILTVLVPVVCIAAQKGELQNGTALIPDLIVSLSKDDGAVLVVEKETQKFMLYTYNGAYEKALEFNCSTGGSSGTKLKSGDRKTPEGIYFFLNEYIDKYLSPVYGTRAFTTDYPNCVDRMAGKNGNAIWLHGTNKPLKPRDTNGCVALENKNINRLSDYVKLNRTAIVIADRLSYVPVGSLDAEKRVVTDFIDSWKDAMEKHSYHEYLALYDDDYLPEISWWPVWEGIRNNLVKLGKPVGVGVENLSIFKHKGAYVAFFDNGLRAPGNYFVAAGKRKLFIAKKGGELKIIGDEYQPLEGVKKPEPRKYPLLTAGIDLEEKIRVSHENPNVPIEKMVAGWIKAWSSGDLKKYASYYASGFYSDGMNRTRWIDNKKRLDKKYSYIRVSMKDLKIKKKKKATEASFYQIYRSSGYKGNGIKKLQLIREGGKWKILRETWKKS